MIRIATNFTREEYEAALFDRTALIANSFPLTPTKPTQPNNRKAKPMTTKTTLPDGTVRVPDRVFADLQRDAINITVTPSGHVVLYFGDGVACDCVRSHPKNVNQWTVVSTRTSTAKPKMTADDLAAVRSLRQELAQARRTMKDKVREAHGRYKTAMAEARNAEMDADRAHAQFAKQEQSILRSIDTIQGQ